MKRDFVLSENFEEMTELQLFFSESKIKVLSLRRGFLLVTNNTGIPDEIFNFVNLHIDSVEKLEILLFLFKNPEKSWTAQAISDRIRTHPSSIAQKLGDLHKVDLLTLEKTAANADLLYKFNSNNLKFVNLVDGLNRCNSERRVSLINLIFSKPQSKVQGFADAFKFKRED
jgi:hypothetical protein